MAVKLRLRRMGKKKQPMYKVVAADSRSPRDGKFLESVGSYNPLTNPHTVELLEDRIFYWLNVGAQPSGDELIDKIKEELDNWVKLREAKNSVVKKRKKNKKKAATEEK